MTVTSVEPRFLARSRQVRISFETLMYIAVLSIAMAVRWIGLGHAPLNSAEARQALAALSLVSSQATPGWAFESPLMHGAIALSMALGGASNAMARLPAMFGGLTLALVPVLFRRYLGRAGTLIAIFLLAISPGAVAASRSITGTSFAMIGLAVVLDALLRYFASRDQRWLVLCGSAFALALLADAGALLASLAMLLGGAFMVVTDEEGVFSPEAIHSLRSAFSWRPILLGALPTVGVVGTLFFLAPGGLGVLADGLARLVTGIYRRPPDVTYVGIILASYDTLLLGLGLTGAWLASQSELLWQRFVAGWGMAALLVLLVYPGALPDQTLWTLVPLALLAVSVVTSLLERTDTDGVPSWGAWLHGVGVVALGGMFLASLTRHLTSPRLASLPGITGASNLPLDLILSGLWVVAGIALWFGLASVWGSTTAWKGTGMGLMAIGVLMAIGSTISSAITRPESPYEVIHVAPAQRELLLMIDTTRQVSTIATGNPLDVELILVGIDEPILAWAYRDFTNVTFARSVDATVSSAIVITPATASDPALGSVYVGQDFPIVRRWKPGQLALKQTLKWLLYRSPGEDSVTERYILWVREDIYKLAISGEARR